MLLSCFNVTCVTADSSSADPTDADAMMMLMRCWCDDDADAMMMLMRWWCWCDDDAMMMRWWCDDDAMMMRIMTQPQSADSVPPLAQSLWSALGAVCQPCKCTGRQATRLYENWYRTLVWPIEEVQYACRPTIIWFDPEWKVWHQLQGLYGFTTSDQSNKGIS